MFVQSTTEIGGAETVLMNAFSASAELRRRSLVVTLGFGRGDLPQRLRHAGADVVEIQGGRLRNPLKVASVVRRLKDVLRDRGVRIAIGNGTHPQVFVALLSMATGVRSVYFVHAIYKEPLWSNGIIDVLALRGPCDLMLANSRASMAAISRLRPRVAVSLLCPGVPTAEVPTAAASQRRAELGAGDADVLFGVFGRLQRGKGQDTFVEAAGREVVQRLPQARFAIVGGSTFGLEPEYDATLRARVEHLGLGTRFVLTGFRSDVPALMAACDVVCHTSRAPESFGMVILEAMAQGRPVIATKSGGPSEIIEDGVDGRLIPPGDPDHLATAMIELGASPMLRRRLGDAARAKVADQFTSLRMAERLLSCLEEVR